jgi:tetratricopeptide (TPR) repeat protein
MELREANRALGEALAAAPEQAPERAAALLTAAGLNLRGGDPARGLAFAEQSLDAAAATGDVAAGWRALQLLGEYELTYGQISVGIGRLEQALEIAQRHGLDAEEALGVYSLAVAHWHARKPDAGQLLDRSVVLFQAIEQTGRPVPAPLNLAEMRTELRVVLEETLQPFVEVSCASALAYVRANQASIARAQGDLAEARALLDESAARFARLGDEHGRAHVLSRQGFVELADGEVDGARARLTGAVELRRSLHERRGVGLALTGLALVETAAGDHTRAEAHLMEAIDIFRRTGDRWGLINALWREADLAVAGADPDRADASLREALDLSREARLERWIAHTLAALAEVSLLRGDHAGAVEQLTDASERYRRAADPAGLAAVRTRLESLADPLQS